MSLESDVIERIRPSVEEITSVKASADRLEGLIKDYIAKEKIDAKTCFVGSFAKGTFLSNNDLDLFVLFPTDYPKDDMEEFCLRMGADLIDGKRAYAEHPYSSGKFEGLDVDLVPCYDIESTDKLMTPVDRSPFHTRYVLSKVDDALCDQIRLTKRFMKGIGTYGAEPDVRGFSGYLCEILTIKYGSFRGLLENAKDWTPGTVVVIEKKGPRIEEPLVVYDPVDAKRNVASAVHESTLKKFVIACNAYLECPKIEFFFPNKREPYSREELRGLADSKGCRMVSVSFDRPDIILENLHAQIWRTEYALSKKLQHYEFEVLSSVHRLYDDRFAIIFSLRADTLSDTQVRMGPPVKVSSSEAFLEKWKGNPYGEPYQENGRWFVVAERTYKYAAPMLLKEAPIAGIGKDIELESMTSDDHEATLEKADTGLMTELLDPVPPWTV